MSNLEQLAELIDDTAKAVIHPDYVLLNPKEIAQAIINAGWTPPEMPTLGYTSHGHPIKGQVQFGKRPPVARCGGTKICVQCAKESN